MYSTNHFQIAKHFKNRYTQDPHEEWEEMTLKECLIDWAECNFAPHRVEYIRENADDIIDSIKW